MQVYTLYILLEYCNLQVNLYAVTDVYSDYMHGDGGVS